MIFPEPSRDVYLVHEATGYPAVSNCSGGGCGGAAARPLAAFVMAIRRPLAGRHHMSHNTVYTFRVDVYAPPCCSRDYHRMDCAWQTHTLFLACQYVRAQRARAAAFVMAIRMSGIWPLAVRHHTSCSKQCELNVQGAYGPYSSPPLLVPDPALCILFETVRA